ncbi:MAG TPA: hypothetical protein VN541_08265 [Tepidisphaeraceae bacterium]|nr:hypothetical protein [Tepidisphaeraceae bacterium]
MKRRREQFDAFSRHEVYDRAFAVQHLWELVEEHPVVVADHVLSAEAARVGEAIAAFYQKAAQRLISLEDVEDLRILDEARQRGAGKTRIPHKRILEEFGLSHLAREAKKSGTSKRGLSAHRRAKPQRRA